MCNAIAQQYSNRKNNIDSCLFIDSVKGNSSCNNNNSNNILTQQPSLPSDTEHKSENKLLIM